MKRYYIVACALCFYGVCSSSDDDVIVGIDSELARDGIGIDHLSRSGDGQQDANIAGNKKTPESQGSLAASHDDKAEPGVGYNTSNK